MLVVHAVVAVAHLPLLGTCLGLMAGVAKHLTLSQFRLSRFRLPRPDGSGVHALRAGVDVVHLETVRFATLHALSALRFDPGISPLVDPVELEVLLLLFVRITHTQWFHMERQGSRMLGGTNGSGDKTRACCYGRCYVAAV